MTLSKKDVIEIMKLKGKVKPGRRTDDRMIVKDIAEKYGVNVSYIRRLWSGYHRKMDEINE